MYSVLIAEDELWIRSALAEMVEALEGPFKVVGEAADGLEAWNLIHDLWPTILITDIMMPQRDGLDLIRLIDEYELPVVTIIISGYDNFQYAQRGIRYGVSEYLIKPVMPKELKEALERSIRRLEKFGEMYELLERIQAFMDQLAEWDTQALFNALPVLLTAILKIGHTKPAQRHSLLRIFSWKLREMIKHSEEADTAPDNFSKMNDEIVRSHFQHLLELWIGQCRQPETGASRLAIRQAYDYIQQHYMNDLSFTEVVRMTPFSSTHFSALFKQFTGESFTSHVNRIRIDRAKLLLLESDLKIYEVAEMVGYASLPYFNRVFKQVSGQSPNEYRKRMGI